MKLFNPFSRIKVLSNRVFELKEQLRNAKLTIISKQHTIIMTRHKVSCLQKELNAVKKLNNKLIGEKMQLKNRLNCLIENN